MRIRALLVAALAATGCPNTPDDQAEDPSPGTLATDSAMTSTLVAPGSPVAFHVSGATLSPDANAVQVFIEHQLVPQSQIAVSPDTITIMPAATMTFEGPKRIEVDANDAGGGVLYAEARVWFAPFQVAVQVVDEVGTPVVGAAVAVAPADDVNVATTFMSNGTPTMVNIPGRTIVYTASTTDGKFGVYGFALQVSGDVTIPVRAIAPASAGDNLDFSQGLAGWNVGTSPVTLIPHAEPHGTRTAPAVADQDAVLYTSGRGPQELYYSFFVNRPTKRVRMRYRFITAEVPGGWFGSEYDDYYSVSIRNDQGTVVQDAASMNQLGLDAFDASGATSWKEIKIDIGPAGDLIQVDAVVANMVDDLYDSSVVIDRLDTKALYITAIKLADIDDSPLTMISVDEHNYLGGTTPVHGTIEIEGEEGDALTGLDLELWADGELLGYASAVPDVQTALFRTFGADGKLAITDPTTLFELAPFVPPDSDNEHAYEVRVHAWTKNGDETNRQYSGSLVPILVRYKGANRYGPRDGNQGGDDWVRPTVRQVLAHYPNVVINDISNMHGGDFPGHKSHYNGANADLLWTDYNFTLLDATVAQRLIGELNEPDFGARIEKVFVTYCGTNKLLHCDSTSRTANLTCTPQKAVSDPIWNVVQHATLADGRAASDVIRPECGHADHFHWRITPEP